MFDSTVSRAMWEAVERFHALTYLAPQVRETATAAGLRGFWMNYFATRIAPVGPVGPDAVQSTFFYYGPRRVNRAIPDAWDFTTPEAIIEARYRGMNLALRDVYGASDTETFEEANELVRGAVAGCTNIGRLLYAGWASLDWPTEPQLGLWHGCTLLREYRSGNHLIAVCAEDLDGCEAVISHAAVGEAPKAWIQDEAGWTAADELAAARRLQDRGWLDDQGHATAECREGRARIERLTNELDFPVWRTLGEAKGQRLFGLLADLVQVLPPDDQLDWQHHYDE